MSCKLNYSAHNQKNNNNRKCFCYTFPNMVIYLLIATLLNSRRWLISHHIFSLYFHILLFLNIVLQNSKKKLLLAFQLVNIASFVLCANVGLFYIMRQSFVSNFLYVRLFTSRENVANEIDVSEFSFLFCASTMYVFVTTMTCFLHIL